ncbi:tyrosine-type recombinase/integrase [Poriferisphaera corsica]|uniref:tyrosine-type recombinase/integrase n=1 Tax=Poriferisphaera corsica TaxID=2528020 RepID=UPI0011A79970|nr:phage integrase SAM-like domain-containing protein [Poriferisphaera corsica]
MSSIRPRVSLRINGCKTVDIYLGAKFKTKTSILDAKRHILNLRDAKASGSSVSRVTSEWVSSIDDKLHDRLVRYGLVSPREVSQRMTLGDLLKDYITQRSKDRKLGKTTEAKDNQTKLDLVECFSITKLLSSFTVADGKRYRTHLENRSSRRSNKHVRLAENTVNRKCGYAKAVFKWAVDNDWMDFNPIHQKGISTATRGNKETKFYVDHNLSSRVLNALDREWSLLFLFGRYLGLRLPSEIQKLKWEHFDWVKCQILIHAQKTSTKRYPPLMPELKAHLETFYPRAAEMKGYVFSSKMRSYKGLAVMFRKELKKHDIECWDKPMQNLRASCARDIIREFGAKAESEWLGHGEDVAMEHYDMLTDEEYQQAVSRPAQVIKQAVPVGVPPVVTDQTAKVTDILTDTYSNTWDQTKTATPSKHKKTPLFSEVWSYLRDIAVLSMGEVGFEPTKT